MPRTQRRLRFAHDLQIEWRSDVADQEEIVVVADEAPARDPAPKVFHGRFQMLRAHEVRLLENKEKQQAQAPPSPEGKTWAEWQRELLRVR